MPLNKNQKILCAVVAAALVAGVGYGYAPAKLKAALSDVGSGTGEDGGSGSKAGSVPRTVRHAPPRPLRKSPPVPRESEDAFKQRCDAAGGTWIERSATAGQRTGSGGMDVTGPQCHYPNGIAGGGK